MSTKGLPRTIGDLPWIGRPAASALAAAGIDRLELVARCTRAELLAMHGVGQKAVALLEAALAERGLSLDTSARSH